MRKFTFYNQLSSMDCGPTCLRMIASYYGRNYSSEFIKAKTHYSKEGVSLNNLSDAAESLGFRTLCAKIKFADLSKVKLPIIVHWKASHFVVVYKIHPKSVWIADPAFGKIRLSHKDFTNNWLANKPTHLEGVFLSLEPTPKFYEKQAEQLTIGIKFFIKYLKPYRKYFFQIVIGMIIGLCLQLIFPILTQAIVDFGINQKNLSFINLIMIGQLVLTGSRMSLELIRSWLFLHISSRINISILSDYLIKILRLPISYFENNSIGDILQRIGDQRRIESFLSVTTLNTFFSMISMIVFGFYLAIFSVKILLIFWVGSIMYIVWTLLFIKKRKEMDYKIFAGNSSNQSKLISLISGIKEIKLYNVEKSKRWEWERIQNHLYNLKTQTLNLSQIQQIGASIINESKNIIITIIAAKLVIDNKITLGEMLSMQYIVGQIQGPIMQLTGFINIYQDAQISIQRLEEVHLMKDEDNVSLINSFEIKNDLTFKNVSFFYPTPGIVMPVINDVSLKVPYGKATAIVGASGSGKTTLLKLILKYYEIEKGEIFIGDTNLNNIKNRIWRDHVAAVLQDGYIFPDTILNNIALVEGVDIDMEKFDQACKICNLHEILLNLPVGDQTVIGGSGHGLSQGQKQRVLLARAVYKNPDILILDEATNALDSQNEKQVFDGIINHFRGKTLLIAAHRLSTIKAADQIIVMDKGTVVEVGTHESLMSQKLNYYKLVLNQT